MYPKIMQHRTDRHSSVVVANEEQEAALPEEYRAPDWAGKDSETGEKRKPGRPRKEAEE